jgi:hypothetical protein
MRRVPPFNSTCSFQVVPVVRVLPQLVWARQNWAILRPLVTTSDAE